MNYCSILQEVTSSMTSTTYLRSHSTHSLSSDCWPRAGIRKMSIIRLFLCMPLARSMPARAFIDKLPIREASLQLSTPFLHSSHNRALCYTDRGSFREVMLRYLVLPVAVASECGIVLTLVTSAASVLVLSLRQLNLSPGLLVERRYS